jgi:hypothetical protein
MAPYRREWGDSPVLRRYGRVPHRDAQAFAQRIFELAGGKLWPYSVQQNKQLGVTRAARWHGRNTRERPLPIFQIALLINSGSCYFTTAELPFVIVVTFPLYGFQTVDVYERPQQQVCAREKSQNL